MKKKLLFPTILSVALVIVMLFPILPLKAQGGSTVYVSYFRLFLYVNTFASGVLTALAAAGLVLHLLGVLRGRPVIWGIFLELAAVSRLLLCAPAVEYPAILPHIITAGSFCARCWFSVPAGRSAMIRALSGGALRSFCCWRCCWR